MKLILIFGDSITYGAWDSEGGWVERLKKSVGKEHFVYNLGVPGDSSKELLGRFEAEARSRLEDFDQQDIIIIVFAVGSNDAAVVVSENRPRISEDEFRGNLKQLIEKARRISSQILFLGITPVDENKTIPLPWAPELKEENGSLSKFNQIILEVCDEEKIKFVDIFNDWIARDYAKWLDDGGHPNNEGHRIIFESVKSTLKL